MRLKSLLAIGGWLLLTAATFLLSTGVFLLIALLALLLAVAWRLAWFSWQDARIRRRDATTESPLERALASELDRRNMPYEREYAISHTRVDFAFPSSKLAVECDGYRYHHLRKREDAARDAFLKSRGWRVLRFSGEQIRADVRGCAQAIQEML